AEWWRRKLDRNMARDRETTAHLAATGWTVLRFWEHTPAGEIATAVRTAVEREKRARKD
ncbi:very short patch repair endonuclease, partial [Streptomyces sp. TRM76130]|nr:very short patch repair endonuclease [Streptomyces sp. TRM76130]